MADNMKKVYVIMEGEYEPVINSIYANKEDVKKEMARLNIEKKWEKFKVEEWDVRETFK